MRWRLRPVIATAAIGLVVGGIGAAVGKVSTLEKELRPMIQRSNLSAESLQVLSKAANVLGSEDGLDGVTDSAQELQLRLAEASQDASGPAVAAFKKLGLSSADLIAASPEDSFLQVITALQGVSNASDKKFLADELLGGSSEKLSGVINASSEEFQGLTDSIRENGDIISNEGIADANEFNLAMGRLSGVFGGIASTVGTAVIPLLTKLLDGVSAAIPILKDTFAPIWEALQEIWVDLQPALADIGDTLINDLLPALQKIWNAISPVLIPVIKVLIRLLFNNLKTAFGVISGAISLVASLLTGDFAGAWESVKKITAAVMNGIITVYNNTIGLIPGVSKIDMVTFADNIEIAEDAVEDLAETAATSSETTVRVIGETAQAAEDAAEKVLAAERQLRIDWVTERKKLLADALELHKQQVQDRQDALDAEIAAIEAFREKERGFQADQLTELKEQFGVTDVEYKIAQASLVTLSADKYAALIEQAEAFGIDDLAILHANNRKLAQAQLAADNARIRKAKETADELLDIAAGGNAKITQRFPDGSGQSGRPAPGPRNKGQGTMDFAYDDGVINFSTIEAGAGIFQARDYGREAEARAWIAAHNPLNLFPGESAPVVAPAVAPVAPPVVGPGVDTGPGGGGPGDYFGGTPGAQHGAIVLPRTGGTRVNVGEAGRAEAIVPLPDLAALAGNLMAGVGGGMGIGGGLGSGSGGGGREVVLALDGERLGSVFLDQFNILQSENRLLVDLV